MNFKKVYELVCEEFPQSGFEIQESSDNKLYMTAYVNVLGYDDNVFVSVNAYDSGTLYVNLLFDHLDKTLENYNLINDFNSNSEIPAYIRGDDEKKQFLLLEHVDIGVKTEEDMANIVKKVIYHLLRRDVAEYLKPLTEATYKD